MAIRIGNRCCGRNFINDTIIGLRPNGVADRWCERNLTVDLSAFNFDASDFILETPYGNFQGTYVDVISQVQAIDGLSEFAGAVLNDNSPCGLGNSAVSFYMTYDETLSLDFMGWRVISPTDPNEFADLTWDPPFCIVTNNMPQYCNQAVGTFTDTSIALFRGYVGQPASVNACRGDYYLNDLATLLPIMNDVIKSQYGSASSVTVSNVGDVYTFIVKTTRFHDGNIYFYDTNTLTTIPVTLTPITC